MNTGVGSIIQPLTQSSKRKCGLRPNPAVRRQRVCRASSSSATSPTTASCSSGSNVRVIFLINHLPSFMDGLPLYSFPKEDRLLHRPTMINIQARVSLGKAAACAAGKCYPQMNANDVSGDTKQPVLLQHDPLLTLRNLGPGTSLASKG